MQNRDALIAELDKTTGAMGRYDLENKLCAAGVPAAAVQTLREFDNNPQTKSLNVITSIHQKGVGDYVVTNTPVLFSKTPVDPNASAAGHPGEHSVEILQQLGYGQDRIDSLLAEGAVHQAG